MAITYASRNKAVSKFSSNSKEDMNSINQLKADKMHLQRLIQRTFPVFSELELRQTIADFASVVKIPKGEIIMDYGSYIKGIPLVLDGVIKVMRSGGDGSELFLHYIYPGETCSVTLTCCRLDKRSPLKSSAFEDTTIINVPVEYMDQWMLRYPSWKNFVLKSYDSCVGQLLSNIDRVAFERMDTRLMDYLEKTVNATQSNTIHTTHAAIALDLNASREAISRLLKQMEKDGIVKLGRNKITLL